MEVGRRNVSHALRPEAVDMVLAVWRELDSPQVGAPELRAIREALRKSFGAAMPLSPAAVARILADAGAELRHPEVIEFDAEWRATEIEKETRQFEPLIELSGTEPLPLKRAESLIRKLEKLRTQVADEEIRMLVIEARQTAVTRAESESIPKRLRAEQLEIAEWLRIWLETPDVFKQWVELRKASPDFRRKFLND